MARKNRLSFTIVELMVVISVITLLVIISVSSFIRARQRTQATMTLNAVRMLDAAVDQWATEYGIGDGMAITLASLAPYVKPGNPFGAILSAGNAPADALGNAFVFGVVGSRQVTVSNATKEALSGIVVWGPY